MKVILLEMMGDSVFNKHFQLATVFPGRFAENDSIHSVSNTFTVFPEVQSGKAANVGCELSQSLGAFWNQALEWLITKRLSNRVS